VSAYYRIAVGLVLAALSVAGFAATFIFGGVLTKRCGVSPIVLSFLRFAVASSVMLAVGASTARGRRKLASPMRSDWLRFAWLGPVGTSVMALFVFMGCARVSAANASMADALTPLMIFAVAALRTRRVECRQLLGLFCGLVGAVLVIQVVSLDGVTLSAYSFGDVCILLAAATWGVYTVYGHDQITRLGASVFTAWTMLVGALSLLPFVFFADVTWPSTVQGWLLVAGLGLISTLMPFWTWNEAQKFLPMSTLCISAYFTPVFAVAMAIIFLGESATLLQWLGTGFVILSALVESKTQRSEHG